MSKHGKQITQLSRSILLPNISWETPLSRRAKKLNCNVFLSLPNYTRSLRSSLLLKMKRTRVPRRQTIMVFSTLESAAQSLYSQKGTWRYGNLLIHSPCSPNRHLGKVTVKWRCSTVTVRQPERDTKVDFSLHCHRVSHTVTLQRESCIARGWCGDFIEVTVLVRSERFPAPWR